MPTPKASRKNSVHPSAIKLATSFLEMFGVALALALATGTVLAQGADVQVQKAHQIQQTNATSTPHFVCIEEGCIRHDLSSQDTCTEVVQSATRDNMWSQGMAVQKAQEQLGGRVVAYKIQWAYGGWSDWYVPGVNDMDWKYNGQNTSLRRVWSYFEDHTHRYILCK